MDDDGDGPLICEAEEGDPKRGWNRQHDEDDTQALHFRSIAANTEQAGLLHRAPMASHLARPQAIVAASCARCPRLAQFIHENGLPQDR